MAARKTRKRTPKAPTYLDLEVDLQATIDLLTKLLEGLKNVTRRV